MIDQELCSHAVAGLDDETPARRERAESPTSIASPDRRYRCEIRPERRAPGLAVQDVRNELKRSSTNLDATTHSSAALVEARPVSPG